jgi:hypothetical protein
MMGAALIKYHRRDHKENKMENKEFVFVLTHSYDAIERAAAALHQRWRPFRALLNQWTRSRR